MNILIQIQIQNAFIQNRLSFLVLFDVNIGQHSQNAHPSPLPSVLAGKKKRRNKIIALQLVCLD